ncbi:hypothetical protein ASPVEDRAFT_45520, partial [Aspergillus versicolor CBS 583.65]
MALLQNNADLKFWGHSDIPPEAASSWCFILTTQGHFRSSPCSLCRRFRLLRCKSVGSSITVWLLSPDVQIHMGCKFQKVFCQRGYYYPDICCSLCIGCCRSSLCCGGVEGFGGAGCDFCVYLFHFLASRTIVAVVMSLALGHTREVVERGEEVDYCVPECHGVRLRGM